MSHQLSQRQAIIIADMLATALVKADMYNDRESFRKDFEYELQRFNSDGDYNEIYRAIFTYLDKEKYS